MSSLPDDLGSDAPEPAEPDETEAWRSRALEAEQLAEELAAELTAARAALAAREAQADAGHLTLFDEVGSESTDLEPTRAADGSEPGILPIALAAIATVAGLAGALSWANSGLSSPFTLVMIVVAGALAWAAWSTRVVASQVAVRDGVVTVTRGDATHRFDLKADSTKIDVSGRPGDTGWRVRFYRRALDPVDVTARMVDPAAFLAKVREYRPGV